MDRIVTRTQDAVARLRAYKPPPFPLWDKLPVSRRAAVLILLFADRRGDLRVVITMRAATLRSFSGPLTPRIDSLCNNCTSSYQLEPREKRSVKPCNAPIKPLNRLKVRGILT